METDNKQLISLLQGIRQEVPSKYHVKFDELSIFYDKKYAFKYHFLFYLILFVTCFLRLWHQLTLNCEVLFASDSEVPKEILVLIFNEFIQKWSKKMNQLSFTKLAVRVAQFLGTPPPIIPIAPFTYYYFYRCCEGYRTA